MLKIYNSLSKQKEVFKPLVPGQVGLYVCGSTVYDYYHLGHARTYLVFDTIVRYFRSLGFQVKYVRNITDIEDKIIKRAHENQESWSDLTERFIEAMHEDEKRLDIIPPDVEPRATGYVPPMLDMIQTLIDKGVAYVGETGDVYYNVQKCESYGAISHRVLDELQAGARVDVNEAKQNPLDFVLWKQAKPGEPKWSSPWGDGRPGWHIECSAMALHELGETFDIHGGGFDLKFPHHENERAQSELCTGKTFVNVWMHVGFVQVNKEKMAKSLGNFITVRDFLKTHNPELLRYFSLASHYRSPVDYTEDNMNLAKKALERLYNALRGLSLAGSEPPEESEFEKRFQEAMCDDFNTPVALSVLFDLTREINRVKETKGTNSEQANALGALLKKLANLLGILNEAPEAYLQSEKAIHLKPEEIEDLIAKRNLARKTKNWQEADRIRDELLDKGVTIEDTAEGTLWR